MAATELHAPAPRPAEETAHDLPTYTTLLGGRDASADGSPLVAHTEDSSNATFDPKRIAVVSPQGQSRTYTSVIRRHAIEPPEEPLRYTSTPNVRPGTGPRAGVAGSRGACPRTTT